MTQEDEVIRALRDVVHERAVDLHGIDRELLEMSQLSQPLMLRLQDEAPSTFQHSVIVANLAEKGAHTIGADSLLARVGCKIRTRRTPWHPRCICPRYAKPRRRRLGVNRRPRAAILADRTSTTASARVP